MADTMDAVDGTGVRGFLVAGHPGHVALGQVVRAFGAVTGTVFLLAAPGLWLLPGASVGADLMPFKLVLSGVFFLVGISLIQLCHDRERVELEVDERRQEIRAVHHSGDHDPRVRAVVPFAEIGSVKAEAGRLVVTDRTGEVILQLVLAGQR